MLRPDGAERPLANNVVNLDEYTFARADKFSRNVLGISFGELDFASASKLVGQLIRSAADNNIATIGTQIVSATGEPIGGLMSVDAKLDGPAAVQGFANKIADELVTARDDERSLVVEVAHNKTLWHKLRKREPHITKTFTFNS